MAWADSTDVIGENGTVHLGAPAPETVLPRFSFSTHITSRLVWVNPDAATSPEREEV
jgi:hypothetical protein